MLLAFTKKKRKKLRRTRKVERKFVKILIGEQAKAIDGLICVLLFGKPP